MPKQHSSFTSGLFKVGARMCRYHEGRFEYFERAFTGKPAMVAEVRRRSLEGWQMIDDFLDEWLVDHYGGEDARSQPTPDGLPAPADDAGAAGGAQPADSQV